MEKIHKYMAKIRNLLKMTFMKVLLFLLLGIIMYATMFSNVRPEKLDLSLFSVAEQTIRSPITIEDKASTEKKKKDAENQVSDVYVVKKEIAQNRVDLITSIFDTASEVNDEIAEEEKKAAEKEAEKAEGEASTPKKIAQEEKLKRTKDKLTEGVTKEVSDEVLIALLQAESNDLSFAKDVTVTAINNIMQERIPADGVENAKKKVENELNLKSFSSNLKLAVVELGRYAIYQNEFYDPVATQEARQAAVEGVEPVKILQGQILVEQNQLISRDVYRQLELVGMLDNENSIQPFIGLGVVIIILLSAIYYYFHELTVSEDVKQNYLLVYSIVFVLSLLLMKGISYIQAFEYSEIVYIFPVAMGGMLIKILIGEKLALYYTVILAICGSLIFNSGITGTFHVTAAIYIICSGIAGILFLSQHNQRSKILQVGLFVSVVNILVILSLMLLRNGQIDLMEYGFYFITGFISGISSAVLTIGFLPFFEAGFGMLSAMKLIELSNPNHPLLRKILTEAPGTYHHSVMVANLSDSACEAIGANGLLARVGCYYHDIGKTKRPQFFIENQMNIENPHDKLPPQTSKNIIIAHAADGAEMLRKNKMPKEIVDIAEQHHGTTLLKFFYHKAKQNGLEVKEEDYRYAGPKAQTKEAAVIGIADSVEAAVRSMSHPTPEQIEDLIRKIIADRLQDGQLNECDLTLKEIEVVAHSFCETLNGIFHSRIEYPEMNNQKVKQA
ncbi:putative nucleotidyltransferase with HDIG domain [Cytobacillus purgationiresistens]|uniref:Nucleotidyltransferase with HDIG domain n=2 Tax=Cytobacillus purgationiresistens TaxID=863449 RepID=A0ABU0AF58_9BACI|nr:HD family phosphohydrolase [Cytobacillus purgationiresistens]MDQ0269494.1 putative nucleotidyltransferase with HDIG domain [Cytobacillus purgationiresistens]